MGSSPRATWLTPANLITSARLLATLPCVLLLLNRQWLAAGAVFLIAVASDFADGFVARRRGEATILGGTFDHTSDALFVSAALAALAHLEFIPLALPPLVLLAFLQYLLDSRALAGHALRSSQLGRWNGIAYFVVAGFAMLGAWTRFEPLSTLVTWVAWLLVGTTLVSMGDRAVYLIRLNRGS